MDKFLHCLRIQIVPGVEEEERIKSIVTFCEKYGFGNVMLFINAEEYNLGHMTKEEAKPWIETILRAKKSLTARGITISLNPWMEIGHTDRCRTLKEGQNFTLMEDYNGKKSTLTVCPLCENWRAYFADFYTYLLRAVQPEVIWVEDDFRLHNHGDLEYGGCFCPIHMKKYNEKLRTNDTREKFRQKLFGKDADENVKRAWLEVSRETMSDTAAFLGRTVKEAGTGAEVGLMSSTAERHAMEARDWHAIANGLSQGKKIHRIHLPCYMERTGKEYLFDLNRTSLAVRAFLPEDVLVYPELENGSFSSFIKNAEFLRFQLESALPLIPRGMTYDIFDFTGNGTDPESGYGEAVRSVTPYLNGVLATGVSFSDRKGVVLPIDEKTVYHRKHIMEFEDLCPDEFYAGAYLSSFGIACKYTTQKKLSGEIVALFGGAADNFTPEELTALFKENFVVLEGGAALRIVERGLGGLIGAKSAKRIPYESTLLSYEEARVETGGIARRRASSFGKAGDYVKIEYDGSVTNLSDTYENTGKYFGNGIVRGENFLLNPYVMNFFQGEQFNSLRVGILKNELKRLGRELVMSGNTGVHCYRFEGEYGNIVIVVNATVQSFDQTCLTVTGPAVREVYAVNRETGKTEKVPFEKEGDLLKVHTPLLSLSTATILIK